MSDVVPLQSHSRCKVTWVPAFAGMTPDVSDVQSSNVIPAEAGIRSTAPQRKVREDRRPKFGTAKLDPTATRRASDACEVNR